MRHPVLGSALGLALALVLAACDSGSGAAADAAAAPPDGAAAPGDGGVAGDAAAHGDAATPADAAAGWYSADPQGRTTEGDLSTAAPELLIVTSAALADAWGAYAQHRMLGGLQTEVATIEDIVAARAGVDDAAKLKAELVARHAAGLKLVLFGGDADVVPYRRVISNINVLVTGATYSADGPAELYFADLAHDWDANGNGVWAEHDVDVTLAQMRAPTLAVGRVPVETAADVATYLAKVELYELAPAGRASYPLLISDIASSVPVLGDIDGAEGLEPIVSALWPQPLKSHALRLYATQAAATKYGGQLFSEAAATSAFNAGYLLGLHSGHGSYDWFTDALDMTWVEGLQNALPPVFLTCACLAGNFADVATTETYDGWRLQGPGEDSVAERFILQPHGGVAYVGNTGVGLGPIGGSQFLYGVFDGLFKQGLPRLGDAVNHGHATMRSVALTMEYVPMSMTDASEWWTHMITILLGDPAIEVWAAEPAAAALTAPATYGPGWQQLTVTATAGGAPLAGAVVTAVKAGDFVLRATTDAAGSATFTIVPRGPAPIELGVSAPGVIGARATISPQG